MIVHPVKTPVINLVFTLFVSSIVVQSVSAAQLQKVYTEVFSGSQLPMIISFFKHTQTKPIILKRSGNKIEGAVDAETTLLANYYQMMIAGDFSKVANLFYEQDGSRERYLTNLKELPTRYDGYVKLTNVYISDRYGWGPFQIVTMRLAGEGGLNLKWREAIICKNDSCYLSNAIDKADQRFELYGAYAFDSLSKIPQSKLESDFEKQKSEYWLPYAAADYVGFKQYPVAVSTGITTLAAIRLELLKANDKNSTVNGYDLYPMFQFMQAVHLLGKDFVSLPTEKIKQQDVSKQLDVLINQHVDKSNNNYQFNLVSKYKSEQGVNVEWYNPVAAIQRISNWDLISILGFSNIRDSLIVYFQPQQGLSDKALIEPVQFFILRKSSDGKWRVALESNKGQFSFLFDDQVMNSIQKQYGQKVSFIYSD